MNEKEGLNLLDFLGTGINKSEVSTAVQAIFSNDEGDGALAREIEELIEFIDYYTCTDKAANHRGTTLEMLTKLFIHTKRQVQEPDSRLLRRMLALTERKGDLIWGNARNMEHVFETYFDHISAFVSEYTNDIRKNLLKDGDFEEDGWNLVGGVSYHAEARFSGKRGIFFEGSPASVSQRVKDLSKGFYTFHFFLLGSCGLRIQRVRDGAFWNGTAEAGRYILAWQEEPYVHEFERETWGDVWCLVRFDEPGEAVIGELVPIAGKTGCIDYARFFEKPPNPSYTITLQFEGYTIAPKTLHLGKGSGDPVTGVNYRRESYYDHAYIIGRRGAYRSEVYQSVLDAVRPRGIQAFVEFVEKTVLIPGADPMPSY